MPYKGSQIVPVRIEAELLSELDVCIERVNANRHDEPYTRSTFVRAAIREKIDHYRRSGKRKKK